MAASSAVDPVNNDQPDSSPNLLQSPALRRLERRNRKGDAVNNPACSVRNDTSEEIENRGWSILPVDIQDCILSKLPYKNLFQAKLVSKYFYDHINSDRFHICREGMRPTEGFLTALHFSAGKHGVWQCSGYDLTSCSWKKLPPFQMLPYLDPTLFKDHSICGADGIMCAYISTSSWTTHRKMIVFNPLTGRWKELPPLNHPRNPVLMQIVMDSTRGDSYKIVAAGSAKAGHEHLAKVTEVFDSRTHIWTVTQALPGPPFALNEHQTGVYRNGILYCIAFLEGEDSGKGVLAFSVDDGKWLPHLSCPLPYPTNLNTLQLVDSNEEIALFSAIEHNPYTGSVEHRIDILEDVVITTSGQGRGKWRNVMSKVCSHAGLQAYPEYACVPFGKGKLCIFNTIVHTGNVYDVWSGNIIEVLHSPTWSTSGESGFYSMNPLTFTFQPSFKGIPKIWLQHPPDWGGSPTLRCTPL